MTRYSLKMDYLELDKELKKYRVSERDLDIKYGKGIERVVRTD